jgi:dipeptidyl aminopeptidase/acylaminoacyl peptidase
MNVNPDLSFNQYFVQDLRPGSQPLAVTHGFYRYSSAEFTPDGKQLIFTADVDSLAHPDRSLETMVYIADADGRHLRMLLGEKDKFFTSAGVSPSGKFLACQFGPTMEVSNPELAIMPLQGDQHDMVRIPFDRSKGSFSWGPDDQYLYFTAPSNGGAPLYRVDIQTRKVEQLTDVNSGTGSYSLQAGRLVFVRTEVDNPYELYSSDPAAKEVKRISSFNEDWVRTRQIVHPEKHEFKDNKGLTIEYWVMKPAGYTPGKKYPLLLDMHGGPSAMWGPGESSMWHEFQYFCSKGYGIVYCNPRGSGGYGREFLRANIEDWGTGPTSDVLTALEKTIAEGWADTSKLVLSGGSYAGYLTAWIVGHDHRFKAACAQRGVYDLATFFGEGNAWRLVPLYFGGYPWETRTKAILQRESPITYVANITTPLIMFHGENDRRTGFVQGEMFYRSLKVLGRPVEYVRHPGATHELTRSGDNRQRIDQLLRTDEFFQRWINNHPPPVVAIN